MPSAKLQNVDEIDIQIGVMLGCEWPIPQIASQLGFKTRQAIYVRMASEAHKHSIEVVRGYTKIAVAQYVAERLKQMEEDLQERKKKIRTKGYKVLEKTLNKALEEEVDVNAIHLRAAEIGIEREEGKALDRKAILERSEKILKIEVDGDDLQGVLEEAARLNELRKKALPAYQEAEIVENE